MEIKVINIGIEITVNAPRQRVFAALTTGVAVWWGAPYLENKEATRELVLEPRVGGRFYEQWGFTGDSEGSLLAYVTAIKKGQLLRLEGPLGMPADITYGRISFALESVKKATLLKFNHQALGPVSEDVERLYNQRWHDLLSRLKHLLEEGKAAGINPDPSLEKN